MTDEDPGMSADGKFQPNVINSAVFLLAAVMQVCTTISSLHSLFLFYSSNSTFGSTCIYSTLRTVCPIMRHISRVFKHVSNWIVSFVSERLTILW